MAKIQYDWDYKVYLKKMTPEERDSEVQQATQEHYIPIYIALPVLLIKIGQRDDTYLKWMQII